MNQKEGAQLLLDPASYSDLETYGTHPMPRAKSLVENYYASLIKLAYVCSSKGDLDGVRDSLERLDDLVRKDVLPVPDQLVPLVTALQAQIGEGRE